MRPPDRTGQTWILGAIGTFLIVGPARFQDAEHPLNRTWYHPARQLDGLTPKEMDLGEWDMSAGWEHTSATYTRIA